MDRCLSLFLVSRFLALSSSLIRRSYPSRCRSELIYVSSARSASSVGRSEAFSVTIRSLRSATIRLASAARCAAIMSFRFFRGIAGVSFRYDDRPTDNTLRLPKLRRPIQACSYRSGSGVGTHQITCRSCGTPLEGREGRFILKYFLVSRPKSPSGKFGFMTRHLQQAA